MNSLIRRPTWCAILLGLCLLLPGRAWAGANDDETVLLLTSPRVGELKNIENLAARGWLTGSNLKVIGIYHAAEWTDYGSAQRWLQKHGRRWIALEAIDCDLSADRVAGKNDCTQAFDALFAKADGIIFTGGPDIPPSLYGEKTRLTTVISDPPRHWFEISLLRHLLVGDPKAGRKPLLDGRPEFLVLGLCLGMQTLNVATGGTLWQDIPSQIYRLNTLEAYGKLPADKRHRSVDAQLAPADEVGWGHLHKVRFKPHRLSKILAPDAKPIATFSLHHQAVHKIGRGLTVWATSTDGKVVEALAHRKYPAVFGVQFHPEKRILTNPSLAYRASPGAEPKNHIAAKMAKDERAMALLKRFWSLVSDLLATSHKARADSMGR